MRFTIEERHLMDIQGRPVSAVENVAFHSLDAETVDDALRLFIRRDSAEVIGDIARFPGFQAIATVRKAGGVYTWQFAPASQAFPWSRG